METSKTHLLSIQVFNKARSALVPHEMGLNRMAWHDWIERESWKRVLGSLLAASTLTMVIFDVNPGFNASQDLEFELFDDEAFWDAESSNEWRELQTNNAKQQQHQNSGRRTLKEVFIDVMSEGKYHSKGSSYQVSAFSAVVIMHAVVVHMWQRLQVSAAFAGPECDASFSGGENDRIGHYLLEDAMKSLARCDAFLQSVKSSAGQPDTDDAAETSLVFNSQAVLRLAYIRLFKPASPSSRINLISRDPVEMDASMTSFVTAEMRRSAQLLDAVAKAFEGFSIPVRLGHLLVRKTAAFRWGVEHAISGWESGAYPTCERMAYLMVPLAIVCSSLLTGVHGCLALLVTKWVHSVELSMLNGVQPTPKERELFTHIQEVLQEAEYDLGESTSLAAGVATTWGWFLHDASQPHPISGLCSSGTTNREWH